MPEFFLEDEKAGSNYVIYAPTGDEVGRGAVETGGFGEFNVPRGGMLEIN